MNDDDQKNESQEKSGSEEESDKDESEKADKESGGGSSDGKGKGIDKLAGNLVAAITGELIRNFPLFAKLIVYLAKRYPHGFSAAMLIAGGIVLLYVVGAFPESSQPLVNKAAEKFIDLGYWFIIVLMGFYVLNKILGMSRGRRDSEEKNIKESKDKKGEQKDEKGEQKDENKTDANGDAKSRSKDSAGQDEGG